MATIHQIGDNGKRKVNWEHIHDKMPTDRSPASKKKRMELFRLFDPNGNNYLSLAEVDRGVRDILGLEVLFDCKPVLIRAFNAAKSANDDPRNIHAKRATNRQQPLGADYVEKCEFRLLLVYLRQYLELWQMFDAVDTDDDRRVDFEEFKKALPLIESWGYKVEDAEAEFKKVDADGAGMLLFDEFADWALRKNLDLPDDDDFEDEALEAHLKK
eukprot:PhM_4_TR3816/c0_g1_i1/m.91983